MSRSRRRNQDSNQTSAICRARFLALLVACAGSVRSAPADEPATARPVDRSQTIVASQTGVVVDGEGQPVAGAKVHLCEPARTVEDYYRRSPDKLLASSTTNERGEFEFRDIQARAYSRDGVRRPGWYAVVEAAGQATHYAALVRDEDFARLQISLASEATINGQVVDESGKPVAYVEVVAANSEPLGRERDSPDPGGLSRLNPPVRPKARTDADGRFRIAGLARERRMALVIRHPGYAYEAAYAATTSQPQPEIRTGRVRGRNERGLIDWDPLPVQIGEVTITLHPGNELVGRVTFGDTGQPYVGARIGLSFYNHQLMALADAEGRFTISGYRYPVGTLSVRAPDQGEYVARAMVVKFAPESRRQEIDVSLPKGTFVEGTVVDESTGKGIGGVGVWDAAGDLDPVRAAVSERLSAPRDARTNALGRFRLLVPSGTREIRIFGPTTGYDLPDKYAHMRGPVADELLKTIEVVPDQPPPEMRFSLGRGLVIAGLVTDPDGQPVEGADVRAVDQFAETINKAQTRTDARGRFRLAGLPAAGGQRVLIVHAERKLRGRIEVPPAAEDPPPLSRAVALGARLLPTARITGRVIDAHGAVAGVQVSIQEFFTDKTGTHGALVGVSAITDADGRYALELIEPEREIVQSVHKDGYEVLGRGFRKFVLQPGDVLEQPDFTLRALDKAVSGIVVDTDGKPVAGLSIEVLERQTGRSIPLVRGEGALSDKQGRFAARHVPDIPLRLRCFYLPEPGAKDLTLKILATVDAAPGQTDVRIVIDAEAVRPIPEKAEAPDKR